jgi:nucleoside-diphosphate-sugar epimerase
MKIFVAGATGLVGKRLVPLLLQAGHRVVGTTRTAGKMADLWDIGAQPVVVDALDRDAIRRAVVEAKPDVVVHQLTDLSRMRNIKHLDKEMATTNRLRTEGTDHLLAAAREAGAQRFVAQSYSGWPNARTGGSVKTEDDALDSDPPKTMKKTLDAIRYLEAAVAGATDISGIVLRYGSFYGPGTAFGEGGEILKAVRQRQFPVVGGGAGVWSFVHIDDVAHATLLAIEGAQTGVYNIVDDEPARVSVWLPELAEAVGAAAPYRIPAWLGRLLIGEAGVTMMTEARGSSNAKAKKLLNWQPRYGSWRAGFRQELAPSPERREHAAPFGSGRYRSKTAG